MDNYQLVRFVQPGTFQGAKFIVTWHLHSTLRNRHHNVRIDSHFLDEDSGPYEDISNALETLSGFSVKENDWCDFACTGTP